MFDTRQVLKDYKFLRKHRDDKEAKYLLILNYKYKMGDTVSKYEVTKDILAILRKETL